MAISQPDAQAIGGQSRRFEHDHAAVPSSGSSLSKTSSNYCNESSVTRSWDVVLPPSSYSAAPRTRRTTADNTRKKDVENPPQLGPSLGAWAELHRVVRSSAPAHGLLQGAGYASTDVKSQHTPPHFVFLVSITRERCSHLAWPYEKLE